MPVSPHTTLVKRLPFIEWANLHAHLVWIYDGEVESRWRHGVVESPHLTAWLVRRGHVKVGLKGKTGAHQVLSGRRFGDMGGTPVGSISRSRPDVRPGKTLRATAGQWMFPPSGDLEREFSEDAKILSVRFRASWPTGEDLFDEGLGVVFPAAAHPELERAARPLARFAASNFPKGFRFLMEEPATLAQHLHLQTLFARWLEVAVTVLTAQGLAPSRMGRIDTRLLKAVQIIDRRSLSSSLEERKLALEVGLSVSQLTRLFIRQFRVSPRVYCDQRRYEHVLSTLQSSPQTIKEVAFELGFSSLPHFSAWFRRRHGLSPRALRQQSAINRN